MRKKIIWALMTLLVFSVFGQAAIARAQNTELGGVHVTVSIESYDRNLARSAVTAYTFGEALKEVEAKNKLNIVYSQDGARSHVFAVNDIPEKKFDADCGWFGYVLRKGTVIKPDNYLKFLLEKDDHIVLYYGNFESTKIVSAFGLTAKKNAITFFARAEQTVWLEKDGKWNHDKAVDNLSGLKIRVRLPDGSIRILKTDENGFAATQFDKLGVYEYFGEGYVSGSYPTVVRTDNYIYLYGIGNDEKVTRGETAAFIVNSFSIQKGENEKNFPDVHAGVQNAREIMSAASAGLISGFEDGSFRPGDDVTLLQFAVMLSGLDLKTNNRVVNMQDVPEWAAQRVEHALKSGLLDGVTKNWNMPVTADTFKQVYINMQTLK